MRHVGYAGRTQEKFRYEGDPNEVVLRISKEAATDILWAHEFASRSALAQVCKALESLGVERAT
jgi:hypothetical protein